MQTQDIIRTVDALAGQQRVILWLRCGHKVSLGIREIHADPALVRKLKSGCTQWECHHCPDLPKPTEREQKTAQQLYREAGEP